jgi:HEAT repeat protein
MKEKARPAVPELSRAATLDSSPELRRQAVQALGAIAAADKAVLGVLMQALKDKEAAVARQAVQALVQAGPAAALPGLLAALEHKDAEVAKTADEALENTKWDKDHAKALGEALLSSSAGPRAKLLKFLTALEADAAETVPSVRELLKKTEPKEVLPILALLAKIGSPAKGAGPELVPFLKRDPKMPLTPAMLETAHLLAEIEAMEEAEAVPVLISALRIDDEVEASMERRDRAMKALVKIGKPAVSKLARALDGEYYIGTTRTAGMPARAIARYRVMEILVAIGSKDAATAEVFKALIYLERNEPYAEVRLAAKQARFKLSQKDEPPMKDGMKDEKKDPKKDG